MILKFQPNCSGFREEINERDNHLKHKSFVHTSLNILNGYFVLWLLHSFWILAGLLFITRNFEYLHKETLLHISISWLINIYYPYFYFLLSQNEAKTENVCQGLIVLVACNGTLHLYEKVYFITFLKLYVSELCLLPKVINLLQYYTFCAEQSLGSVSDKLLLL